MARIYLGNIKGPQGETGATGATGPQGDAATVNVGSVSTTAYGNAAQVVNVGTENDAVLNFVIPQGKPGEKTTTMSGLTLDTVTTSADEFPVPAVSENGSTVWGKVIKFFQDTVAALTGKLDANKIVNSQAVTEAGYGLDALQANPSVSGSLAAQISDLNDSLTTYTDGIWRVRKMNDGTMECWGSHSKSVSANSDDSSVWVNLPSGFTNIPVVTYGVIAGGADLYRAHIVSKDTESIRFLYTNKHTAAVTIATDIYVIGRWK